MTSIARPLLLYFAPTPNGRKAAIILEELKAVYGSRLNYDVERIQLSKNTQKEPWFIKLNPNGKIPVLVDRSRDNFTVFESAAIFFYLEHHYDLEKRFTYDVQEHPHHYSEILQWVFFAHGGLGPMQGQANHFLHAAPEKIPYAQKRYIDETKRLYNVLNIRLDNRDWLAGPGKGKYTIADMNAMPWVNGHKFSGIESLDEFPNVKAWVERILARPTVQKAFEQ